MTDILYVLSLQHIKTYNTYSCNSSIKEIITLELSNGMYFNIFISYNLLCSITYFYIKILTYPALDNVKNYYYLSSYKFPHNLIKINFYKYSRIYNYKENINNYIKYKNYNIFMNSIIQISLSINKLNIPKFIDFNCFKSTNSKKFCHINLVNLQLLNNKLYNINYFTYVMTKNNNNIFTQDICSVIKSLYT